MPFWRRRREEQPPADDLAEPPVPSDLVELPGSAPDESTLPPDVLAPTADAPSATGDPEPAAFAPFDPTAFLAVAPAHTLDEGLERTRTGFMSQLRGLLGGDDPHWDDVEEILIARSY